MKKLLVIPVLAICLNSCIDKSSEEKEDIKKETSINALTDEEKKDGWQLLFDGTSTKGWHKYGDTATGSAWKIDSVTNDEYDNFDLKLEWKIDTCGNSGIIIFITEDTAKYTWGWQTGPEMQILDNKCHPDTAYITHRAGSLYDLITVSKETVKPALEWNQVEIKSLNGKLDFWLNGENVVSTTMWDDNWKKMIAGSKFKAHPDFGTVKKGKLGLQDHGNNVWFRNIKIKKI